MREIKFRCWDNEANVMLSDISDGMMIQMNSGKVGWYDDHGDFEEKNYPLMQFTGLKDKNGKEVYDKDIYRNGENGLIIGLLEITKTIGGDLVYCTERKDGNTWNHIPFYELDITDFEIIGNIHANPELLWHSLTK